VGTPVLKAGTSAVWFSAFSGLIPCKVLSITEDKQSATVTVTRDHGCYKLGETLTRSTRDVVPVMAVRNSRQRLGGFYNVHYEIVVPPVDRQVGGAVVMGKPEASAVEAWSLPSGPQQ
jgi:hypothetical protein